jgi:pimeloyl-ACP methyl ester carboxylesterase
MRHPETRYVELAEGRRMRVRRWPGRGTPLVMLHGLLDSSDGWDPLARATHRPSIAIDLPGFGHSDRAGWPAAASLSRWFTSSPTDHLPP